MSSRGLSVYCYSSSLCTVPGPAAFVRYQDHIRYVWYQDHIRYVQYQDHIRYVRYQDHIRYVRYQDQQQLMYGIRTSSYSLAHLIIRTRWTLAKKQVKQECDGSVVRCT